MATWLTADDEQLPILWVDAPVEDPPTMALYLAVAREACEAFAPDLPEGVTEIPDGWRLAQAMQARNIWNVGMTSPSGDFTGEGSSYAISSFPLDWQVQQLLRPRRAMGAIL